VALGAVGLPAAAQVAGRAVSCAGQRISEIEVQTRPPSSPRNGKWWTSPVGFLS
jgi:hypothetical protein